jgi:lipid-binding SYLF domain-containing protein
MKAFIVAASLLLPTVGMCARTVQERLNDATEVFNEIMATPDKGIPQDLLAKAECVVIVPGAKKAAFVVGGEYGRGFAVCRHESGRGWGAPGAVRMEGASVGFQIGGSSTDLVMLVMNRHGVEQLMRDKFTLRADASAAAGPVGRTADANTDALMTAEILAWSRTKGLFAGVSVAGSTLRNDLDENEHLYGSKLNNREVLMTAIARPPAAEELIHTLDKYSMRGPNADRSVHDHQ